MTLFEIIMDPWAKISENKAKTPMPANVWWLGATLGVANLHGPTWTRNFPIGTSKICLVGDIYAKPCRQSNWHKQGAWVLGWVACLAAPPPPAPLCVPGCAVGPPTTHCTIGAMTPPLQGSSDNHIHSKFTTRMGLLCMLVTSISLNLFYWN